MRNFCRFCGEELISSSDFFVHLGKDNERKYSLMYCNDDPDDPSKAIPKIKEDYIKEFINEGCL